MKSGSAAPLPWRGGHEAVAMNRCRPWGRAGLPGVRAPGGGVPSLPGFLDAMDAAIWQTSTRAQSGLG